MMCSPAGNISKDAFRGWRNAPLRPEWNRATGTGVLASSFRYSCERGKWGCHWSDIKWEWPTSGFVERRHRYSRPSGATNTRFLSANHHYHLATLTSLQDLPTMPPHSLFLEEWPSSDFTSSASKSNFGGAEWFPFKLRHLPESVLHHSILATISPCPSWNPARYDATDSRSASKDFGRRSDLIESLAVRVCVCRVYRRSVR